jgi:SAM-dependent methyltransferase
MILKKAFFALINPRKWGEMGRQVHLLLVNIFIHRNLSFNLNSKIYWNDKLSKFDEFWRDEHYVNILDLFPPDSEFSLLDVGCALGDGCELLKKNFPNAHITGIDISDVGIEKAKKKTKEIEYFVMDILKDPLPQMYDYIAIVQTLEHFDDPFLVVDKCLKHVNKELIISVPYTPDSHGKILEVSEHRYFFNENTFKDYKSSVAKISDIETETIISSIVYKIQPDNKGNPKLS